MSDTYTPTTEEVREAVAEWTWSRRMFRPDLSVSDNEEFERWLAAHDAQVREEALREVQGVLRSSSLPLGMTELMAAQATIREALGTIARLSASLVHDEGEKR